jgi:site-specific DNA-methyltransferase (adenine-specific)
MSFRIEQADPLALLRELPDEWAQTCVTSPRRDVPIPYLLAVLDEVHRVLREDGTLWLGLTRGGNFHHLKDALKDTRWVQPLPASAIPRGVLMLTKQSDFLFRTLAPARAGSPQSALCARCPVAQRPGRDCRRCLRPRRAWCIPSSGEAEIPPREVIEWCIVASTVPCACGVCGAPFKDTERCKRWQATCAHQDGRGRSLVIDPFCSTGETGIVAVRRRRHYLGIDPNPAHADAASRRLAALLEHRR